MNSSSALNAASQTQR